MSNLNLWLINLHNSNYVFTTKERDVIIVTFTNRSTRRNIEKRFSGICSTPLKSLCRSKLYSDRERKDWEQKSFCSAVSFSSPLFTMVRWVLQLYFNLKWVSYSLQLFTMVRWIMNSLASFKLKWASFSSQLFTMVSWILQLFFKLKWV